MCTFVAFLNIHFFFFCAKWLAHDRKKRGSEGLACLYVYIYSARLHNNMRQRIMPPKRAAAVCRGQLTLVQCAAKKQKQSIDPTEDSEGELASQEGDLDSHRSKSKSGSEPG